jgi:hypothetical protein
MHPRQRPRHVRVRMRTRPGQMFPGFFDHFSGAVFDHETSGGGGPFDNLNVNTKPVPKGVLRKIPKSNMLPNVTFFSVFLALWCHPAHDCNIFILIFGNNKWNIVVLSVRNCISDFRF